MTRTTNPLAYPKSAEPLDYELFRRPSAEYRGCPLWSWNNRLDAEDLLRQIDDFQEMGMGGFHIHSRVGLDTPYLGEEFMEMVEKCVGKAEKQKLLACLYDEDRWPSGCAGGKVVADRPEYKLQHLLLTPLPYGHLGEKPAPSASGRAVRSEEGYLLARYQVHLNQDGSLAPESRMLEPSETAGDNVWYAYVEPNPPSEWFNSETYVDTFSKPAINRFLEITHEMYKSKVGSDFGSVVPSIFTDEPQFAHKTQLRDAHQKQDVFLPWSLDILDSFQTRYGHDLLKGLLEVIWDRPRHEGASVTRYHFHDHICERFVEAFMDQISTWCRKNNIFLIGHMMKEPFLWSQTDAIGEAMRCYRNLDLPGVDILCDRFEFNTVKQAVSVARQNGRRGAMSELYGVTNWTFDFEGHKGSGDWQAALGITFRVPHLTWASMGGEAKRDYPASIGYQSPWFREYSSMETYFARINVVMTRGKPVTRVGVIHPIESFWLCRGPVSQSFEEQDFREQAFGDLTQWLLDGLIDFDFISESLLPSQVGQTPDPVQPMPTLSVGKCQYEVILVPNLKTIRLTTLEILKAFAEAGGKVVIAGEAPSLVDAARPMGQAELHITGSPVPFSKTHILRALSEQRDIRITDVSGKPSKNLLYQLRQDGSSRFIFICNTERKTGRFTVPSKVVSLRGLWEVNILDPFTGEQMPMKSEVSQDGRWTDLKYRFDGCASLLLELSPGTPNPTLSEALALAEEYRAIDDVRIKNVSLSEPNVLLLDYAEYKLGSEMAWNREEEVLRIDNLVRSKFQMPLKMEAYKQPWAIAKEQRKPVSTLHLRFRFRSAIDIESPLHLALEDASSAAIVLNGKSVLSTISGWWVDKAIQKVRLPDGIIRKGENLLLLSIPFGVLTNTERIYLLGSFAVNLSGRYATLEAGPQPIVFGDWSRQGLPFYAGNVIYHCTISVQASKEPIAVSIPRFSAPLLAISLDGIRVGIIAFEPHILELGIVAQGDHELTIECFGNRFNAFGHLHLPTGASPWCGPLLWRTEDDWWTPEYSIVPMGVLETPRIMVRGKPKVPVWKEGPTY